MSKDKLDLVIDRIDDLKDSTEGRLDSIDNNLQEHMRRTDVLEKLHTDNQKRIEMLEEPSKARKYIKNMALYIAAVTGAVVGIFKLIDII